MKTALLRVVLFLKYVMKKFNGEKKLYCLRCNNVVLDTTLTRKSSFFQEISFFECPSCHRSYAKKSFKSLTYQWRHPISIALYDLFFHSDPSEGYVQSAYNALIYRRSEDDIKLIIDEIALELDSPTIKVSKILDGHDVSEKRCRDFLSLVVKLANSSKASQ